MSSIELTLQQLQSNTGNPSKTTATMELSMVFKSRQDNEYNEFNIYLSHFGTIPNFTHIRDVDCKRANEWFLGKFATAIKDNYFVKRQAGGNKQAELDDIFYFLEEDLLINFDTNKGVVRFLFRKTPYAQVESILNHLQRFKTKKGRKSPEIKLLVSGNGITTLSQKITRPKLSIEDNYNDDFHAVHQLILKRLSAKNDKGMVMLHGKPGTGKTSYIRYLVSKLGKDVIFLPPDMASALTNPELLKLLIFNTNSVLVIEDAENIISDREHNGHSPASVLLNISDGLLSDCLKIQIICSFNTDLSKIDKAFLRKGRLIARYEFKELTVEKASNLSSKLGFSSAIHSPMTLSAVYHQEEMDFNYASPRAAIGFRANIT
jgi:hypothetical protein